jgi:uncharacterized protein
MDNHLLLALLIMAAGFLGSVLPILPGPPLVWLGALYYGWATQFAAYGWPTLILMLLLAIAGSTADTWLSAIVTRKSGASIWATLASIVGGIVGLLVLSLPGLFIGALGAIALVEYSQHKDWNKVLQASKGYLKGYLLSLVVQVLTCLVMIGIFVAALVF